MKHKSLLLNRLYYRFLLYIGVIVLLLSACARQQSSSIPDESNEGSKNSDLQIPQVIITDNYLPEPTLLDATLFIPEIQFYDSISNPKIYEIEGTVLGGIIPHHNVAYRILGDFYASLSVIRQPEVIILIGPNHSSIGERFQTGLYSSKTYSGTMNMDNDLVTTLITNKYLAPANTSLFATEHSLNIHFNYINYYFKDARVLPILVNETRTDKGLDYLAEGLAELTKDLDVLILCSIDFSHYLTLEEANKNDELTQVLLVEKNGKNLISLGNDYVDCPSAIYLMYKLLDKIDKTNCIVLDHDNSANILKNNSPEGTTSYFSVIYTSFED